MNDKWGNQKMVGALQRAIQQDQLANAYLFVADQQVDVFDFAMQFLCSILAPEDHEQQKELYQRIIDGNHADVIVYQQSTISKEMIDHLQQQFWTSSQEVGTKRKVYLIHEIENVSLAGLNSLLKFIEEPPANTYAILTSRHVERILPTILSRCTVFSLLPQSFMEIFENCLQEGIDQETAFFAAMVYDQGIDVKTFIQQRIFQQALKCFQDYIEHGHAMLYEFEKQYYQKNVDTKQDLMQLIRYFHRFLYFYYKMAMKNEQMGPDWFQNRHQNKNLLREKLLVVFDQETKINKYHDLLMVLYQTIYRLEVLG